MLQSLIIWPAWLKHRQYRGLRHDASWRERCKVWEKKIDNRQESTGTSYVLLRESSQKAQRWVAPPFPTNQVHQAKKNLQGFHVHKPSVLQCVFRTVFDTVSESVHYESLDLMDWTIYMPALNISFLLFLWRNPHNLQRDWVSRISFINLSTSYNMIPVNTFFFCARL